MRGDAPNNRAASGEFASLLFVATVASTVRFLIPYARHFRGLGWRVEAAARGAASDSELAHAFDHIHELPISRSIADVRGLAHGERAIARIIRQTSPDVVHVHTPIASFLTRFAVRRMPAGQRPLVAYTAHGFHFHGHGRWAPNQLFLAAERLAGPWTDRLIVINDEDEEAARRHRLVATARLVRMRGIGLDTSYYSPANVSPESAATARRFFGIADDVPLFVAMGELNRNKRQADAIEALASMRHTSGHLLILGNRARAPSPGGTGEEPSR